MIDLSIIIVNYKSSHHVMNCLHSIYESRMNISHEIIIVDNASNDSSRYKICSLYKELIWIQSEYNAGFARANNMGIKASRGRNILLLNADTIITNNAIEQTLIKFENDKQYAACGAQLLNTDSSKQQSGARFVVGGINNFLALPYLGNAIKKLGYNFGLKQHNVVDMQQDMQVDWIVGAFIMTRRSIIEKSGLLDEDFFMYAEEIEWCSRIRKNGPLILYHSPKVTHIGGGTSSKFYKKESNENFSDLFDRKGKQIILSQLLRIRKQYGVVWYFIHLLVYIFEIVLFGACMIIENAIRINNRKFGYSEWKGYTRNILGISHFFPAISINKHIFYKA